MKDTEFLIDTRTRELATFPDWASAAISSPKELHIPPLEVMGLSPDRDRPEILLRVLTAHWMLARHSPGRRLVECHAADGWGRALRAAKVAASSIASRADTILRLNNHLYDRAVTAPHEEWLRLEKTDYGQYIRRGVPMRISDRRCCAKRARAVLVERRCASIRQEALMQEAERREKLATLCAEARHGGIGVLDRAAHRLVPAGAGSYCSPTSLRASILPSDLAVLADKLTSSPWLLCLVDTASCPASVANLFCERSGPQGLAATASPMLGEILDECRHHVAWTFLFFIAPKPTGTVDGFAQLVQSRWQEAHGHALLCDGERCMIKPAGRSACSVNCVRSIAEAEAVLSRELYAPWSIEVIGSFGFDQWTRHQAYPHYFVPLGWLL